MRPSLINKLFYHLALLFQTLPAEPIVLPGYPKSISIFHHDVIWNMHGRLSLHLKISVCVFDFVDLYMRGLGLLTFTCGF